MDRRRFLKGAAGAGAAVTAGTLLPVIQPAQSRAGRDFDVPPSLPVDKVVRTTCSPNCTGSCGQLAFVRDGAVVKIQQAADYPDNAYNPRGCMKGLSYINQIYNKDRIMTPLIRTGERGSGEFREATWDEVLDRVAGEFKRIGETHGWDSIHVFGQVPGSGYIHKGANYRASALLGMTHGTSFDFNGDLPMGMPITFGVQNSDHEAKDWANARFLLIVGANPIETRIPDVRHLLDAVERGARMVVIDPVYSGTASKADSHIRIKPGTDAALGLALVRQVLEDGQADLDFMRTYTDAALLVRTDTGRRLREADLVAGGADDRFAVWDEASRKAVTIGTDRLGMPPGVIAALGGTYEIALKDGARIEVTPGFALVRAEVDRWTPEAAEAVTEIPSETIVRLARAYAAAKPAAIFMGGGAFHWYHGDLVGRAFALLATITGNIGRSGGGFSVYVGQYKVRVNVAPWWSPDGKKAKIVPSIYFLRGPTDTMHPDVPYPEAGYKGLWVSFSNFVLQSPDVNRLHQTLRDLDFIVVTDHQMTDTVAWADVVLPATTWYEKTDLTATPLHPFLQLQQAAIAPVGESRSELDMWREIVRRIDPAMAAEYFDVSEDDAIRMILEAGAEPGGPTQGITLEQLREGPVRLNVPDPDIPFLAQINDLEPFPPRSLPASLEATAKFLPTRRIEFYKEEDRFQELGEAVPVYRDARDDGVHDPAEYPFVLLSPHSKWRIHSSFSNNPWLAEIHGGHATVLIHPEEAAERGIAAGDAIEVSNTRGSLVAIAELSEAARRGTATLPEGWWSRYFRAGNGVNELTSSAVNPIHEVHYVANMWAPSTGWKDCRVQIRRADEEVAP